MDDQTKVKALEKAQGMVEHIGYPQGRNRYVYRYSQC